MARTLSKAPVDPKTFEPTLAALDLALEAKDREIEAVEEQLSETPDDATLLQHHVDLKAERRALVDRRQLQAKLQQAAKVKFAKAEREKWFELVVRDFTEVDHLGAQQSEIVFSVARDIVNLGPRLQRFAEISEERRAIAWGVLRAGGATKVDAHQRASGRAGPLATLLEAAFRAAGIGALAPTTGISVPSAPVKGDSRQFFAGPGGTRIAAPMEPAEPLDLFEEARLAIERENEAINTTLFGAVKAAASEAGVEVPPVKKLDPVELVAIGCGYLPSGRRVVAGDRFMFDPTPCYPGGKPRKPPRWALPPPQAAKILQAHDALQRNPDTKPADAQQVARSKSQRGRE